MSLEIDIENILAEKNPKLARLIPRWLFRYVKRTIRQDDINQILRDYGHLEGTQFIQAVLEQWHFKAQITELALPEPGKRYIFAANHPLGGLDGLILATEIERRYGEVKIMVNDLLMNITPLKPLFVPVNKYGKQSIQYARELKKMYDSDAQILLFPAGLCSRKIRFKVQDPPWKKNVIAKSVSHQRDIIPVYFDARNSNFFYNISLLRKMLGIKANIEMIYLPDEMFRQENKYIRIIFGKPIPYQTFTKEKRPDEWAKWLREQVYALKKQL